ncbi:hypothetical protein WICMUC_003870 [Wickerhamomyces mucosus]|uniref:dolichyl-phosphate beta-glucosyltransferase n=1 Tax=Wickerhamomyces mucosus TaxID=1378264 RepID=A0A9P8PJU6_9ASCO|nr:hypothetical protein WICMUC_003870 [Wickerhamomyces mucosus]
MVNNTGLFVYFGSGLFVTLSFVYSVIIFFSHKPRAIHDSELYYETVLLNNKGIDPIKYRLPDHSKESLNPLDNIKVSLVIPCYNEIKRLKIMLDEAIGYLQENYDSEWEIIIVDDGSSDGTADYSLELANEVFKLKPGQIRVVKLVKNRGKGGAVAHGLKFIRGEFGIFADADGASKFSDLSKLVQSISSFPKETGAIAIGSRAHMVTSDAVVKRSLIRNFLMYSLHTLVFIFGIREIKDTQCGFKLFNRKAIWEIFPYLHTEGWIFDVEVLIIAIRKKIPIKEVPISWHEVDGSKVDLARDSINMAIDLVITRLAYILGIYRDTK